MAVEEGLRQELETQIAARQELEDALQKAAEYGQDLLAQVQEHERTIQEYREKERASEIDLPKSQAQRRQSTARRASTIHFAPTQTSRGDGDDGGNHDGSARRRVAFLPGSPDSDEEEPAQKERPGKAAPRRGRGGHTMVVEDLMQHNQSLEEDLRRLQENYQKLQEQDDSEDEEDDEGSKGKLRVHATASLRSPLLQQQTKEIEELRQALRTAQKEAAKQLQALEAEVESKKQEIEERKVAEQVAKSNAAQSETKCKALQEKLHILMEESEKTERELQVAKAKERDLTFQLEEQALRNKARTQRKWMPTACEEALHSAAARASLADEFEDMEEKEEVMDAISESDEMADDHEGCDENVGGGKADTLQEMQGLQEKLSAAKEEAALRQQQLEEAKVASLKEMQGFLEELATAKADAESSKEAAALRQQQLEEAKATASKEMQGLQEELAAAKADAESSKEVATLRQQQLEQAQAEAPIEIQGLQEELAAAKADAESSKEVASLRQQQLEEAKVSGSKQLAKQLQEAQATQAAAAKDLRVAASELAGLRLQVENFQAQQKEAESQKQKLAEVKELEAAKHEDVRKQLQAAKDQAEVVLAENAKLRREVNALKEARDAPTQPDRQEEEDTFWGRVMASIACARTASKPTSPSSSGRIGLAQAEPEPIRLAMPNTNANV